MKDRLQYLTETELKYRRDYKGTMFLCDVDMVLADIIGDHLRKYNVLLNMNLTNEEIAIASKRYKSTFDIPAVQKAREMNEHAFQEARAIIREDKNLHRDFPVMDNAHPMMYNVSEQIAYGHGVFGGYYSARPQKTGEVTLVWLQKHKFPDATKNKVFISEDSKAKLIQIIQNWGKHYPWIERVVLIDDSVSALQHAAAELAVEHPHLESFLNNICVAAFSYTEQDIPKLKSPIKTTPLPNWDRIPVEEFLDLTSNT